MQDLRKEKTWWPGSIAKRSGPKSYVVVLNDGRVWKRHLDHVRRDTMDSAVSKGNEVEESRNTVPDPVQQSSFGASVPLPPQLPSNTPVMQSVESGAPVHLEEKSNSQSGTEKSTSPETASPETEQAPLRRSIRVRKAADRLIETV